MPKRNCSQPVKLTKEVKVMIKTLRECYHDLINYYVSLQVREPEKQAAMDLICFTKDYTERKTLRSQKRID